MHAFSIVAFLLIPILYALIQHLLLHPLRVLNQAQKRLRNGDLDCRITEKANSIEYEHSFQSFNKMADRIQDLKIEVYEKELDRKQMELSNLQLQIRPHFLLNTFNLIYTLAQRGQEKDVQQVILYLSDYFRLSLPERPESGNFREGTASDRGLYRNGKGSLSRSY